MSLKEELLKLRKKITKMEENDIMEPCEEETSVQSSSNNTYLEEEVESFINWYTNYKTQGYDTANRERYFANKMRNMIEKVAVWYELRYPDYELSDILFHEDKNFSKVSKIMFQENPYVQDLLGNNSEIQELDWDGFYNTKSFLSALSSDEKYYFIKPRYPDTVYWDHSHSPAHLHLDENGMIEIAEDMECLGAEFSNKTLEGKNIREVLQMIQEKEIDIPEENGFTRAIHNYDDWNYQKEEMLNCIMYRIIERGGSGYGPWRAFLFAQEFHRNIDIPMMYAVDRSNPRLRLFINEYLKAGGSKDLNCYQGYFTREDKHEKLNTISIQELLLTQPNNAATFYTPEEQQLHQRLVSILTSQINPTILKQEQIKQLRLKRKIEKQKRKKD